MQIRYGFTSADLLFTVAICAAIMAIAIESANLLLDPGITSWGLVASADGSRLASVFTLGHSRQTIEVWEVSTRKRVFSIPGPQDEYLQDSVALAPDGKLLARFDHRQETHSRDVVELWDVDAQTRLRHWDKSVQRLQFSPDSQRLACLLHDYSIEIVDVRDGAIALHLNQPIKYECDAIAFSPDGSSLAGQLSDRIAIWDLQSGAETSFATNSRQNIGSHCVKMAFAPDGKSIATAMVTSPVFKKTAPDVTLWDVATGRLSGSFSSPRKVMCDLCFLRGGDILAVSENDSSAEGGNQIRFMRVPDLKKLRSVSTGESIHGLAAMPPGDFLAAEVHPTIYIMNVDGVNDTDVLGTDLPNTLRKKRILAYVSASVAVLVLWIVIRVRRHRRAALQAAA